MIFNTSGRDHYAVYGTLGQPKGIRRILEQEQKTAPESGEKETKVAMDSSSGSSLCCHGNCELAFIPSSV